jgi:hypothetical protein
MFSKPVVRLAQTVHLSCTDTNIVSKRIEMRFDMTHVIYEFHRVRRKWFLILWYVLRKLCTYLAPTQTSCQTDRNKVPRDARRLWVPSGASKTISEHMVRSAQTVHLSRVKISTISKQTKWASNLACHLAVPLGGQKRFLSLWYIWRKPCTYLVSTLTPSPNGPKQDSHDPSHLGVPLGASKMVSDPIVCSAQTMHLSCTNINTLSKWTETRFHVMHITEEFHRVRPKQFLSQWYIQRKPCTYLASRLELSPNRPKWASTSASSPWSTIGCIQNDFWAYGMLGRNHAPISHQR